MSSTSSILWLLSAVLCMSGCASTSGVTLPPLPAWIAPVGLPATVTASAVAAETRRLAPNAQIVSFSDATYTLVSRRWLDQYIEWTWYAAKAAGVSYTPESFDCEEFGSLFSALAGLAASKAGVKARPLTPELVVAWDAGARHALNGVATDEGPVIVEPQPSGNLRIWRLADYPREILSISFGAYNPPSIYVPVVAQ